MAFRSDPFIMAFGAQAGDDPALEADLRQAFVESIRRQADLLRRARCDGNWRVAAERLRGIAASFHADELVDLADVAIAGAPGDPAIVGRVEAFAAGLA